MDMGVDTGQGALERAVPRLLRDEPFAEKRPPRSGTVPTISLQPRAQSLEISFREVDDQGLDPLRVIEKALLATRLHGDGHLAIKFREPPNAIIAAKRILDQGHDTEHVAD